MHTGIGLGNLLRSSSPWIVVLDRPNPRVIGTYQPICSRSRKQHTRLAEVILTNAQGCFGRLKSKISIPLVARHSLLKGRVLNGRYADHGEYQEEYQTDNQRRPVLQIFSHDTHLTRLRIATTLPNVCRRRPSAATAAPLKLIDCTAPPLFATMLSSVLLNRRRKRTLTTLDQSATSLAVRYSLATGLLPVLMPYSTWKSSTPSTNSAGLALTSDRLAKRRCIHSALTGVPSFESRAVSLTKNAISSKAMTSASVAGPMRIRRGGAWSR